MLMILSFLLSGQLFISYRQRDSSTPKLFTALLGVGAMGGRLLDRFQADLNRGLAAAIGIWSVFWTWAAICTAEYSGICLKLLFIKGAKSVVPPTPSSVPLILTPPPAALCLREIPKGVELRLARAKMSSALCGWDQRL